MNIAAGIMAIISAIGFIMFVSFLFSWPTYMLWNGCLVGAIDGIREVTWMQAWGLTFLCNTLFKTTITK